MRRDVLLHDGLRAVSPLKVCSASDDPSTYGTEARTVTTEREKSCAERLPGELASRLEDIRAILAREDYDEPADDDDELPPLNEYGLGSEVRYSIRVELSTGGPADYVTAEVSGGEVLSARYHFADWFDHAEKRLEGAELDTVRDWLAALFDLDSLSMYVDPD